MADAPNRLRMEITVTKATDWTHYYSKPKRVASITRSITQKKIIKSLKPYFQNRDFSVCEYGGANSCVVEKLCGEFAVSNYHVIDSNQYGLSLLSDLNPKTNLTSQAGDVISSERKHRDRFDLVFSIGLIEHFDEEGTRKAIKTHLDACKPNGIVLITFPTPTILYKTIRAFAEAIGVWEFPDERPLGFSEVISVVDKDATILHRSVNWAIGLTQGYIILRKHDEIS